MKNLLQMDLPEFSRYLMKYTLTILILFVFTSNVFSQECDETTRARMIKSGISDKTIEEQCGKIGEKEQVSENNAKEETDVKVVENDEDTKSFQKRKYQVQVILLSGLGSGGSFNYYFKNNISVGIDSQSMSDSMDTYDSTKTYKYESKYNLSTTYYYGRYYPSNNFTSFFLQGGLVSRSWKIESQGYQVSNNEKTIKYTSKYPNTALNIALGWNWIHEDSGISGGIYFVNIIGGDPKHTYVMSKGWTCSDTCKEVWEDYVEENVRTFVGMINLGYNF
jgi:hypothetical protein